MKIIRDTPQQLIVGENPIFISVMLVFMMLLFAGIAMAIIASGDLTGFGFLIGVIVPGILLYVFARRVQLIFDAQQGTLTVQRKSLRKATTVIHQLHEVKEAILETSQGENGKLYRVTLVMTGQSEGRKPLADSYSNIGNHRGVEEAINDWLKSYRETAR